MAARFSGPGQPYEGLATRDPRPRWTGEVRLVPEKLADPLRWQRPRRVFVNSMSDLFHESLGNETIDKVIAVMLLAPRHTFQVLTKRVKRMRDYLTDPALYGRILRCADEVRHKFPALAAVGVSNPTTHPAPWIWWGVSTENQATADERIPLLLQCPAAVRWISAEPLLGRLDLTRIQWPNKGGHRVDVLRFGYWDDRLGFVNHSDMHEWSSPLDWVVVGGESGSNARPCDVAWIESIVEQCGGASVPVFVKQLGASIVWRLSDGRHANDPARYGTAVQSRIAGGVTHPKGGDISEFPESLRVRQWPAGVVAP
jgi:protein gp37